MIKEWADHQENMKELIEEKTELQKRIRELELLIDLKQSQLQVSSLLKESEMQENRKISSSLLKSLSRNAGLADPQRMLKLLFREIFVKRYWLYFLPTVIKPKNPEADQNIYRIEIKGFRP